MMQIGHFLVILTSIRKGYAHKGGLLLVYQHLSRVCFHVALPRLAQTWELGNYTVNLLRNVNMLCKHVWSVWNIRFGVINELERSTTTSPQAARHLEKN